MAKKNKPKSKARKIIEWIFTILFVLVFGGVAVMNIVSFATKDKNNGVPNFFGTQILIVLTDSMEPVYKVDEALFVQKVSPSKLKVGDDVTFIYPVRGVDTPMTHRIFDIKAPYTDPDTQDGHYLFVAHGVNKNSKQCGGDCSESEENIQHFNETKLLGKVVGHSVFVGATFNFMTQPWGLLVLLLLPALYLIVTSVIDIVRAAKLDDEKVVATQEAQDANPDDKLARLSEEDKKRLKEELLNEMIDEKMNKGDK